MIRSCETVGKRILDQNKFTYISSVTDVSELAYIDTYYKINDDASLNSYCCHLCQSIPSCVAFNNWRTNNTCNFYKAKISVYKLALGVSPSRFNVYAGLRSSE
jgi:hypothetical protein